MANPQKGYSFEWTSKGGNNVSSIGANCHIYSFKHPKNDKGVVVEDKFCVDLGAGSGDFGAWGYHRILPNIIDDLENMDKIILTHAHGDHVEALFYYLMSPAMTLRGGLEMGFDLPPIWGTPYTIAKTKQFFTTRVGRIMASKEIPDSVKQDVHKRFDHAMGKMNIFYPGQTIKVGRSVHVTAVPMSHNTLHCIGLFIQAPTASVFHSGDFNVDQTYRHPCRVDFNELKEIGAQGVDVALMDSTGADHRQSDIFEEEIAQNLEKIITDNPDKRAVLTVMGGHDQRLITLMEIARKTGRVLQVAGSSMQLTFDIFKETGLIPEDLEIHYITRAGQEERISPDKAILVSTGSQGEKKTPFVRAILENNYKMVTLDAKKDVVIFSSTMLNMNKARIAPVLNGLQRMKIKTYHQDNTDLALDAHGHANAVGIQKVLRAISPTFGFPMHGTSTPRDDVRTKGHLQFCADLMRSTNTTPFIASNNQTYRLDHPDGPKLIKDHAAKHSWIGVQTFTHMGNWAETYLIVDHQPDQKNEKDQKNDFNVGRSFDNII